MPIPLYMDRDSEREQNNISYKGNLPANAFIEN